MKPETENWLKIARYDLSSAKGSFKTKHYLKVYESCHTSLEKLLKGIITEYGKTKPPKIHDLLKLTSLALIKELQSEIKQILDELNKVYMLSRYPEDFESITSTLTKKRTKEMIKKTERIFKWLEKKIN